MKSQTGDSEKNSSSDKEDNSTSKDNIRISRRIKARSQRQQIFEEESAHDQQQPQRGKSKTHRKSQSRESKTKISPGPRNSTGSVVRIPTDGRMVVNEFTDEDVLMGESCCYTF